MFFVLMNRLEFNTFTINSATAKFILPENSGVMTGHRYNLCINGRPSSKRIFVMVCFIMCPICTILLLNVHTPDFKQYTSSTNLSPAYNLTNTVNSPLSTKDDFPVTHPSNDETTLINLTNFQFTINHDPCKNSQPLIVGLIHSAPKNYAKRMTIRETWGNKVHGIVALFFVGMTSDLQSKLEEEDKTYGDIVQGNFVDSYRNLTYKHVMLLKWAKYHCPNVKYVLKLDDDVFVNTPAMLGSMARNMSLWGTNRVMHCSPAWCRTPQRKAGLKWTVTLDEYPEKMYPEYCLGWVIIYTIDTAIFLYEEAQRTPYFWIDDVHVTGIVANKVNLTYTSLNSQILRGKRLADFIKSPKATVDFLIAGPELSEADSRALWKAIVSTLT
ncbi:beta-1,3-galactosyltransferase 5-like isoform X1 [Neodiprion virginianus]|uniref:beta-1,3-galactosyltransferase 5-like isoform X1 n=2 Tax=Neodiprion virginianus TaxID=2961670 RepID=UPI001EE69AC0|nr:beta-1,3-galactosyltransferase 5-like isoform X1 [Neodiprion virginianus]